MKHPIFMEYHPYKKYWMVGYGWVVKTIKSYWIAKLYYYTCVIRHVLRRLGSKSPTI